MDIRRLRVENPDYLFHPFFSAMLAQEKDVRRNFLTTVKMAINEMRAKEITIPKWSVIMINPGWEMHSTNELYLLDQLNDNENFMICQTKKIIDNPKQINATINEMMKNSVSGWFINKSHLQSLFNSTSIEVCDGGFIISTEILIRLERLGLMLAPLGNIIDRKMALGSWWYANNDLFNPFSFWLYNLANHASTAHFKGANLKLTSLDELNDAENNISGSTESDEFIEYSKSPDFFIRPKSDTKEPSVYPTIIELPEHFRKNVKQKELDFLIRPSNACSEKRSLVSLIKTSNNAYRNRKWVRHMFKTLLPEHDYYLYFLVGYEDEQKQVFQNGKPYWVVNKDAPKISKPLQQEVEEYGDMIVADFPDTYDNLPIKTLSGYQFLKDNCAQKYDIVTFTDDDTFLDLPNILKYSTTHLQSSEAAFRCLKGRPIDPTSAPYSGKYYIYPDIWPPSHIVPSYCNGQCCLLTRAAAEKIFSIALNTSRHEFRLEDFYFAGILRHKAGITNIKGIVTKTENEYKNGLCMHLGKPLTEETLTPLLEEYKEGTLRIGISA
ncbi:unnamed protein product [Oikopleura dioica]|uniref:Hexosyltransferase n=2 Tax=Oikopleura dioica TaxID=34765 RepID=E4XM41_OIKDI|nr:unnamed protein product [Oikopleura dioica]